MIQNKPTSYDTRANIAFILVAAVVLLIILTAGAYLLYSNSAQLQSAHTHASYTRQLLRMVCTFMEENKEMRMVEALGMQMEQLYAQDQAIDKNDATRECEAELDDTDTALFYALLRTRPDDEIAHSWTDSFRELINTFPFLTKDIPAVYYADNRSQLLGLALQSNDQRAYVVLNFSYDVHTLPLPLGFMASTKIALWQSDRPTLRRFVTRGRLSIRAQSAAVVIVQ